MDTAKIMTKDNQIWSLEDFQKEYDSIQENLKNLHRSLPNIEFHGGVMSPNYSTIYEKMNASVTPRLHRNRALFIEIDDTIMRLNNAWKQMDGLQLIQMIEGNDWPWIDEAFTTLSGTDYERIVSTSPDDDAIVDSITWNTEDRYANPLYMAWTKVLTSCCVNAKEFLSKPKRPIGFSFDPSTLLTGTKEPNQPIYYTTAQKRKLEIKELLNLKTEHLNALKQTYSLIEKYRVECSKRFTDLKSAS